MQVITTEITLATAVADSGTVAVAYPAGTTQSQFTGTNAVEGGSVALNQDHILREADGDIELSYGGSNVTLTNDSGFTWAAGTKVLVGLAYLEPGSVSGLTARVTSLEGRVDELESA